MAEFESDTIRQALRTAREYGFTSLKLRFGEHYFEADLSQATHANSPSVRADFREQAPLPDETEFFEVRAPAVGYFRAAATPVTLGDEVEEDSVIGAVMALGLANDITSSQSGVIKEMCVEAGQPVQFGQTVARIKRHL